MLLLRLTKVEGPDRSGGGYRDHDDEGDLARPNEKTRVVYVYAEKIRNFQPRRNNAIGSRLTFDDGGGYAVLESPEEIIGFIGAEVRGREGEVVQLTHSSAQ